MAKELDFETLLSESSKIIEKLNAGELNLKESLDLYKKGAQMLENAQELLEKSKLEYENLQAPKE